MKGTAINHKRKKVCPHCGRKLWLRDFYPVTGGYSSWCKHCQRQNKRDWYEKNHKVPDGIRQCQTDGRIYEHRGLSKRIFWNKQMTDDLKRLFATTRNEDLAELVGVSPRTLVRKARELGLNKDQQWQHGNVMRNLKMAQFESRRLGYPGHIMKGQHRSPETEFKKIDI